MMLKRVDDNADKLQRLTVVSLRDCHPKGEDQARSLHGVNKG